MNEPKVPRLSSPNSISGQIVGVGDLSDTQRENMFALMVQYYDNICRSTFESDLDEKDWVILATDDSNTIQGFSTQLVFELEAEERTPPPSKPIKILFSGDTIIARNYWGRNPLAQLWGRLVLTLIDHNPDSEMYWFLISKGFRTYRFLPVFFKHFFPSPYESTPSSLAKLITRIAKSRYGDRFDPNLGIIRACEKSGKLRAGIGEVTAERSTNRHVAFFESRNPGHARGDELCCLAHLTRENFNPLAYRVIGQPQTISL